MVTKRSTRFREFFMMYEDEKLLVLDNTISKKYEDRSNIMYIFVIKTA